MRAVTAFTFIAFVATGLAQDSVTDSFNDKINTIEGKPSVRLDPYIRKALLKALTELEESDSTIDDEEGGGTSTTDTEILKSGDDITEASSTESAKQGIQIHSFIVNGQGAFDNKTSYEMPTVIKNKISILGTTAGNVENQITGTLPTQVPFHEIFQAGETGANLQQVRSIKNNVPSKSNDVTLITKGTTTTKRPTTTTTTTSTTTTTPKPTHNDDGENIEEVDKKDVQVFTAPLVAAFTVHQDAQGSPKKVIPIFQQPSRQLPVIAPQLPLAQTPIEQTSLRLPKPVAEQSQNFIVHKSPNEEFINHQLFLQKQLEEKQRYLEEQLQLLQLQQKQQEELLRNQQFLLQQKESQRQQFLQDQQTLQNNQASHIFSQQLPQKVFQTEFQTQNPLTRQQNTLVSIQPSLTLGQSTTVASQQQLPNREAVDFLLHLRNQQSEQFPLQENHLPRGVNNFLRPTPSLPIYHQNSFEPVRSIEDSFRPKHGTRVFRHETGTGNFGFNNINQNFNRFNGFTPVNTNRFPPFNRYSSSDAELKQLLLQSGLSGRAQEDLNIVSKVLSLNHGIPTNNKLLFDTRRQVRNPF